MATTSVFIPVDRVIALASSLLEGADTIDRAYFKEWIGVGLSEIGPNLAWYGEATLYPTDNSFRKPEDFYEAIDIGLWGGEREVAFVFRGKGSRIHESDNRLVNDGVYAPGLGAPVDLSEDQYYFHLGSNGSNVTHAVLKYWKFPVDENGDIMVPEQDLMPLALFCRYCYYMRKDDKTGIGMSHNTWIAARNEARSNHKAPSMMEGTEIARSWNSMIKKMRFKKF